MKNPAQEKPSNLHGSEPEADAARDDGQPKFHGGQWSEAQERGNVLVSDSSLQEEADTRVESSAEQVGMGRGEKPRKPVSR